MTIQTTNIDATSGDAVDLTSGDEAFYTIANNVTIEAQSGEGIVAESGASFFIYNNGNIVANGYGVELENANDHFYNEPGGTVFGYFAAALTATDETFVNYGAASGDFYGAEDTAGDNTIANYGMIEGPSAGLYITGGGDTITNATTGTIGGGITVVSGGQTITNAGAIDGSITFSGTVNSDPDSLTNTGEITGTITLAGGTTTIDNEGTITGVDGTAISAAGGSTVTIYGTIAGSSSAIAFGNGGDNVLNVGAGAVFIGAVTGGDETDTVNFLAAGSHAIGNFSGFEVYDLSSAGANTLTLSAANFAGVVGSEITVNGGNAGDTVSAAGVPSTDILHFVATGGNNVITGGAGNDIITTGSGNDILNGGPGADVMTGGAGNDTYYVDNVGDQVIEAPSGGTDTVISTISYSLPSSVENLTLGGTGNIDGSGNGLANVIVGNAGNNVLFGGTGADTLTGGGGSDTFKYTATNQSPTGAGKFDRITDFTAGSGTGHDLISFAAVSGVTTIQGLIKPASPSTTPPTTGLNAHSIAWYQVGSETVVIANASATAGHVDMEIVLSGVTASALSTVSGVNFTPDGPAGAAKAAPSAHASEVGGEQTSHADPPAPEWTFVGAGDHSADAFPIEHAAGSLLIGGGLDVGMPTQTASLGDWLFH